MTNIPDDSEEKKDILDLNDDGKISINESMRAEAGLLGEFAKQGAKRKGLVGWFNRTLSRLLGRVDNH